MMGDKEFDAFYSVSYSRLVGQLYAMTGDWAEAREVVLEAFIRAWDHRSHFDLESMPDSWIRTVAWRLLGTRRYERRLAGDDAGTPAERVEFVEALRGLDEEQRRATVLHYLCDRDTEEIAAETGVAVATVEASLARGRAALAGAGALGGGQGRVEKLVDELYDLVNRSVHPRLSAHEVREQGRRRRLGRRSATVGSVAALALAGIVVMMVLVGRPDSPTVTPSAGHRTGAPHAVATRSPF